MPVRRRTDSTPDAWMVDFRVGGKRYRYTVRAETEADALRLEADLRTRAKGDKRINKTPAQFRGAHKAQWIRLLDNARARALRRGEQFPLTKPQFFNLVARSRNRCELTGIRFSWKRVPGLRIRPFAPSLDRIDRSLGYNRSNLRLVCAALNIAINEWGEDVFREIASAYLSEQDVGTVTGADPPEPNPTHGVAAE